MNNIKEVAFLKHGVVTTADWYEVGYDLSIGTTFSSVTWMTS